MTAPTVVGDPLGTGTHPDFQPPTVGLLGILRILFKWSFVVAPLMALTVWVALSQTESIEPEYTAESALLLVGSSEVVIENPETGELEITGVNPLQQLGSTLSTVAGVTALALSDDSVRLQLVEEGLTDSFIIGPEGRTPVLRVRVTDVSPEVAEATADRMAVLAIEDLKKRQDDLGAPENNRIGAQVISSGLVGGADFGARTRLRLAIAAVGFAAAAASAFLLEGIFELWRRRKRRKAAALAAPAQRALPSGDPPIDRLAAHRVSSAKELVRSERDTLVGVLHMVTGDEDLAEAIGAEACAAATEEWSNIEYGEPVEWLYGRAIRQAWAQPEHEFTEHPVDTALWKAVQTMPEDTRTVLALASIADFTNPRIAGALDMTVNAVARHRAAASDTLATLTDDSSIDKSLQARRRPDTEDSDDEVKASRNGEVDQSAQKRSSKDKASKDKATKKRRPGSRKAASSDNETPDTDEPPHEPDTMRPTGKI